MRQLLLAMALLSAPIAKANAQSWTFFGCSSFSCHTATFVKTAIEPATDYDHTWTAHLSISWTHEFGKNGAFFDWRNTYSYPQPTYTSYQLDRLWDIYGWNGASICGFNPCFGTVHDWRSGLVRDEWDIAGTSVAVYNNETAVYHPGLPGFDRPMWDPGPLTVVQMQLVPEPSTYALLGVGLAVLLTTAGKRERVRSA